jgi:aspartate 1-decarboxylase
MRKIVAAKLPGVEATYADLHYHGSNTLDPEHRELAGILRLEFVDIRNKLSGARLSTYVSFGGRGSRACCLSGAPFEAFRWAIRVLFARPLILMRFRYRRPTPGC